MAMRVVLVGGGIVGGSIAFHLQARGAEVILLDANPDPPQDASRASFAWMNARDKNPRAYHDLNRRSLDLWARFADRLDADIGLTWGGDLRWTRTPASAAESEARVRQLQAWGYPARMVDREEAERMAPGIRFGEFTGASLSESDGHVDGPATVRALYRAAERLGARVDLGVGVTGFAVSDGRIKAVEVGEATYACDVCVIAAGADTTNVARLAGVEVPTYHTFGATVVTTPVSPLFEGPSVLHGPKEDEIPLAVRQFGDGTVILHGGRHGEMHDESFGRDDDEARRLLNAAAGTAPALDGADIVEVRRARRPIPRDGQSVVGFAPEKSNCYLAVTHSGVTLAPLIGTFAATEIVDGVSVDLLQPFRPDRFGRSK